MASVLEGVRVLDLSSGVAGDRPGDAGRQVEYTHAFEDAGHDLLLRGSGQDRAGSAGGHQDGAGVGDLVHGGAA